MLSFRRRWQQNGLPFYVVRELTDKEWGSSVRIDLSNGLVASVEGRGFVVLYGESNLSRRIAATVEYALGPQVETRQDLAACGEWNSVSSPTVEYLGSYAERTAPRAIIAIVPTGIFKQIGLRLQRVAPWVDIFDSLILKVEPGSGRYQRVQCIHKPVHPLDDVALQIISGKLR